MIFESFGFFCTYMDENLEVLLVDSGNSSIKTTEVRKGILGTTRLWADLDEVIQAYPNAKMAISSVRKLPEDLLKRPQTLIIGHELALPIELNYKTPETLGIDRIAAAVGATELFPKQNNLVVDLGTCMTMDVIDEQAIYQGGIISPGLKMRMRAMADYTDRLPNISLSWEQIGSKTLGSSTKECLRAGSFGGILREINGIVETLKQDFTSLNIILTGGDAQHFESYLKAHIFAGSKIVQTGIYRIWKDHQK